MTSPKICHFRGLIVLCPSPHILWHICNSVQCHSDPNETFYSKTLKMTNFGPVICKNSHFQVTFKTVICEVLHGHFHHLQGMRTLNANHHLPRSVTFEAVICEVLLYTVITQKIVALCFSTLVFLVIFSQTFWLF
jgi:hypothetical protein